MPIEHKHIGKIDLVVVAGSILALIVLVLVIGWRTPQVISPIDNFETTEKGILFSFENANLILIDDNPEFSSPDEIYVEDNLVINLKPGKHYWKIKGLTESEIRELTVLSEVDLKLKSLGGESYGIVNAGNTRLNVDVYDNSKLTEKITLGIDEEREVSGTKFIGEENE